MGQEVLQFVNAGFNPLQQISKKTGETMIVLKKRMEDGAISSREVADAFKAATAEGGLFYKAIERGSTTTSGKIAKVKDSLLSVRIAFGTGFNDGLRDALDAMNDGIPKVNAAATEMGKQIGMGISEAVNGDTERLIGIGKVIGVAIKEGMKISLMAASGEIAETVFKTGESIADKVAPSFITGGMKKIGISPGDYVEKNKGYTNRTMMADAINNVRAAAAAVTSIAAKETIAPRSSPFLDAYNAPAATPNAGLVSFNQESIAVLRDIRDAVNKPFPN